MAQIVHSTKNIAAPIGIAHRLGEQVLSSQSGSKPAINLYVGELQEREQANVLCITLLGRSRLDNAWRVSHFDEECRCRIRRSTQDNSRDLCLEVGPFCNGKHIVIELDWPLNEHQFVEALNLAGRRLTQSEADTGKNRNWLTSLLGGLVGQKKPAAPERGLAEPPAVDRRGIINRYLDRFGLALRHSSTRNILLVGSPGSGKTTAIQSVSERNLRTTDVPATDSVASLKGMTTISIDYGECEIGTTTLRLFGTPGQMRFAHMIRQTLRNCDAALALVDLTSPDPIADLQRYADLLADFGVPGGRPMLVGLTHMDIGRIPRNFRQRLISSLPGHSMPTVPLDPREPNSVRRALALLSRSTDRPLAALPASASPASGDQAKATSIV